MNLKASISIKLTLLVYSYGSTTGVELAGHKSYSAEFRSFLAFSTIIRKVLFVLSIVTLE